MPATIWQILNMKRRICDDRKRKLCDSAETYFLKTSEITPVNLFLAGFSHLEPQWVESSSPPSLKYNFVERPATANNDGFKQLFRGFSKL